MNQDTLSEDSHYTLRVGPTCLMWPVINKHVGILFSNNFKEPPQLVTYLSCESLIAGQTLISLISPNRCYSLLDVIPINSVKYSYVLGIYP